MTFQLTSNRTGRPRIPAAGLDRRRERYLDLRKRIPMTNAEIAKKLGQHPVWVAGYSRGRPPTDESMDILEERPEPAERLEAYRRLREIVDGSDAHFASVLDIPESRARRFWRKPPTWNEIREMAVVYDEYHNQSFGTGGEEYADLLNNFGPKDFPPGKYEIYLAAAKAEIDAYFQQGRELEKFIESLPD
jgi:hypothetical protein